MKKIVLIDASPRKGGNSEAVTDLIANDLAGCEVTVFKMREKDCRPCRACGFCQGKNTQQCVQKDDITALLPVIEHCDAIMLAAPIYNQQITSQAKLFIERFYPFFKADGKSMSNTAKYGKKAALVCSCWGSPRDITEQYAAWTVSGFSQIGAEQFKALVFDGIPERGQIREHADYLEQVHRLAGWFAE